MIGRIRTTLRLIILGFADVCGSTVVGNLVACGLRNVGLLAGGGTYKMRHVASASGMLETERDMVNQPGNGT